MSSYFYNILSRENNQDSLLEGHNRSDADSIESGVILMYCHLMKCNYRNKMAPDWLSSIRRGNQLINTPNKTAYKNIADGLLDENSIIFKRIKRNVIKDYEKDGNGKSENIFISICNDFPTLDSLKEWQSIKDYLINIAIKNNDTKAEENLKNNY